MAVRTSGATTPHRYPLTAGGAPADQTVVQIGRDPRSPVVGGRELLVIVGPCSVEGPEMLRVAARAARAAGASALRGGAFKPRTSPYAFQGLGERALEMLATVRADTGLPIVTEVLDPRHVERVAEVADVLQVGTRNMHNTPLLTEVAQSGRPVLLKRGYAARIDEFLLAAEYVMAAGNSDIILCERGIRTFETETRNTLDIAAVPLLKAETHLPVIVDPSHGAGRRSLVAPLSYAAIAAGADGLLIEMHPEPESALSDGDQSITPAELGDLMAGLRAIADAVGRSLPEPPNEHDRPPSEHRVPPVEHAALEALRGRIEEADHAILDLAARRAELARRCGEIKRGLGHPIIDVPREREVEQLMLARGRELALPANHIRALTRALIAVARAAQLDRDPEQKV